MRSSNLVLLIPDNMINNIRKKCITLKQN
jgi:hypothetical protein